MSLSEFGVTAESIRTRFFPHQDAFSTASIPTAATVALIVTDQAAILDGKLRIEDIDPASIDDTASAAYKWCAYTIRLASAIEAMESSTNQDSALLEQWRNRLKARWADLSDNGYLSMGDGVDAPAQQADGPNHHIDEYSITVQDEDDISSLDTNLIRRSDQL
jgi:hypothetical protein